MLEQFFEDIKQRRDEQLSLRAAKWPRNNPIASDISRCARETALGVLHWEDRPAFGLDLLARLEAGTEQENLANMKMLSLGIRPVEQQRAFELKDAKGRLLLRGKIDGKIQIGKQLVPYDLKTMHPSIFDRFNTIEDLLANPFFSKYPKQIMAYQYMNNIDIGFLWLDNMLGKWKFIEVPLDWEMMERILRQLETAVESIEQIRNGEPEDKALPPFHADPSYCLKCWAFKRVCTPPFFNGEGMKMINDPEFADKLARRAELDQAATQYDHLDKEIKETLKAAMKPTDNWIIGDFLVTAKESSRKAFSVAATKFLKFDIEKLEDTPAAEKSSADYEDQQGV